MGVATPATQGRRPRTPTADPRRAVVVLALALDGCTQLVGTVDASVASSDCPGHSSERGGAIEGDPQRSALATPEAGFHAMGLDRAGHVYLLGSWVAASDRGDEEALVMRLRRDGTVDATFGDGGTARVRPEGNPGYTQFLSMAEDDAGRLVFAGSVCRDVGSAMPLACRGLLARLDAQGRLDAGFGRGGQREYGLSATGGDGPMVFFGVAVDGARVVAAGSDNDQYSRRTGGFVLRLREDGSLDTDFDADGARFDPGAASVVALAVTARGYLAAGTSRADGVARLAAFTRDGAPDARFGAQGVADLVAVGPFSVRALTVVPGGGFALAGPVATDLTRTVVARVDERGAPTQGFGEMGFVSIPGAPWAENYMHGGSLAAQCDGRLVVTSWSSPALPRVRRLMADGAVDRSFGDAGSVELGTGTFPLGVAVDPTDHALVTVTAPWDEGARAVAWRLRP